MGLHEGRGRQLRPEVGVAGPSYKGSRSFYFGVGKAFSSSALDGSLAYPTCGCLGVKDEDPNSASIIKEWMVERDSSMVITRELRCSFFQVERGDMGKGWGAFGKPYLGKAE
ncbi:hypothetical protein VNO77_19379 [Canavalia gladiata]|uniref:Uncharacterized protein n=1 Tax=Canavalia gladiata TaxID=3824 RepID=A0AAN9QPJ7_CANGL